MTGSQFFAMWVDDAVCKRIAWLARFTIRICQTGLRLLAFFGGSCFLRRQLRVPSSAVGVTHKYISVLWELYKISQCFSSKIKTSKPRKINFHWFFSTWWANFNCSLDGILVFTTPMILRIKRGNSCKLSTDLYTLAADGPSCPLAVGGAYCYLRPWGVVAKGLPTLLLACTPRLWRENRQA